jgi:formylglycine-generating enzyme required for sulfatase activity
MSPEGFYHFSFPAEAGQIYPIAASPDLAHWSLLTNAVGAGGALAITDPEALKLKHRFYQIGIPGNMLLSPPSNMVLIPPGTFVMGSPDLESGRVTDEGPQTIVRLSRPYWIGKYEVTQAEYVSVMGSNISSFFWSPNLPVDFALFSHATNYAYQLTLRERAAGRLPAGYVYRLPTEAEWEYACRGGTITPFGVGNGTTLSATQANFDGGFPYGGAPKSTNLNYTQIVGSYAPNAWGIYDMHGNVWEWCQDFYGPYPGGRVTDPQGPATGTEHVLRGGAYDSVGKSCRSARRDHRPPTYKNTIQGFRVVLAPAP